MSYFLAFADCAVARGCFLALAGCVFGSTLSRFSHRGLCRASNFLAFADCSVAGFLAFAGFRPFRSLSRIRSTRRPNCHELVQHLLTLEGRRSISCGCELFIAHRSNPPYLSADLRGESAEPHSLRPLVQVVDKVGRYKAAWCATNLAVVGNRWRAHASQPLHKFHLAKVVRIFASVSNMQMCGAYGLMAYCDGEIEGAAAS